MNDVIFAINKTIEQFPTGLVQEVHRSPKASVHIYLDGDFDDYQDFQDELAEKVIPLGFDFKSNIYRADKCHIKVYPSDEHDASFVDTKAMITPSFHDFENESEFPYRRGCIGELFTFAYQYDRFVRFNNNEAKFEQAGTGLLFKVHFGDCEIADGFQSILETCNYDVVDARGDL